MRSARVVLSLGVVLLMASPLLAGPGKHAPKKQKKAPPCPAAQRVEKMLKGIDLTDAQKAQLKEIQKEFGPKLMAAMKKADVLKPEQKKARAEAAKAAKAAGKKGKEAHEAVEAAVKLTDDQKASMAEARKEIGSLEKELRAAVAAVLTPEQKEKLPKAGHGHHGKKKAAK